MNVHEAAVCVLREARSPLPAREIAQRMLSAGLWHTEGKTPDATVAARLYTDIKKRGSASPFVLAGPQTFGLSERSEGDVSRELPSVGLSSGPRERGALSFTQAAEKVLNGFGGRRPMHYRAITKKALDLGWIATSGRTPEATMYAQILTEIRRHRERGEQPRFWQHGKGYVSLSRWMGEGLVFEIEQHNKRVRQSLRKRLSALEPEEFEKLIGQLLVEIGFENIQVIGRSGDGGIDVRGTLVVGNVIKTRMAVQVKRWKMRNNVHSPVVQQVRGSLGTHDHGLIITTSDFSPGARKEAERSDAVPVGLMNGEQLVELLAEQEIGIVRQSHDIIVLAEENQSPAD
jgi:restriction system protein